MDHSFVTSYALVQIVDIAHLDQAVVGLPIHPERVLVGGKPQPGADEFRPRLYRTMPWKFMRPANEAAYLINELPASSGVVLDSDDEPEFVWRLLNPDALPPAARRPCGTIDGWEWAMVPEPGDMDYHLPQAPGQLGNRGPVVVPSDQPTALPPTVARVPMSGRSAGTAEALACAMEVLQEAINARHPSNGLRATYEAAMSTLQGVFDQVGCEEISEVVHGHDEVTRLTDIIDTIVFG